jgi:hypothetical protein
MAALLSNTHGGTSSKTHSFLNTKGDAIAFATFFFVAILASFELDDVKTVKTHERSVSSSIVFCVGKIGAG